MILIALLLGLQGLAQLAPAGPVAEKTPTEFQVAPRYSIEQILDAVRVIESGAQPNGGREAIGDGGRALGPYQIHRAYFIDAGVAGRYEDCRDPEFARRVVLAYWKRWCPEALERCDAEVLARVHNGGPRGARKSSTLAFWRKVEGSLAKTAPTRSLQKDARPATVESRTVRPSFEGIRPGACVWSWFARCGRVSWCVAW